MVVRRLGFRMKVMRNRARVGSGFPSDARGEANVLLLAEQRYDI